MPLRIVPKSIWLFVLLFATGISLARCVGSQEFPPQNLSRDPFSIRSQGEDGVLMELSGNSRGHVPGGESAFDLRLVNQGQVTWSGEYCVQLVDKSGVLTTFEQSDFSLEPGEALLQPLRLIFSNDLPEGAYGLGLVISERWANITTIYLGDGMDQAAGPWVEPVCP